MSRPTLSLVIPCYNEELVIPELDRRLKEFLGSIDETWEVVFIDDGSVDKTRELLGKLCAEEERDKFIGLARNFGHQLAITAGADYASGEAVVIMDADALEMAQPSPSKEMSSITLWVFT